MHTPSICPDRPAIATSGSAGETGGIDFPIRFWIGFAFIVLGTLLDALAIVQYRRSVATLRPVEMPPGYWVNLSVYAAAILALLGIPLALYLSLG